MLKVLFLSFFLFPFVAISQEWLPLYQKAQSSYDADDLKAAYDNGLNALKKYQSEKGETNDNYTSILRLLANICYSSEKFEEGLGYAQKEIQIREPKKDVVLSTALDNAALFFRELGNYEKSIEYLVRSKEILLGFYSFDEAQVVNCDLQLAINYYLANDNHQAFVLFSSALGKVKKEEIETLQAYYYFGLLNLEIGDYQKALTLFEGTQKKYDENKLETTVDYALLISGLGDTHHKLSHFEVAESNYGKAQQILEQLNLSGNEEYFHLLNSRAINFEMLDKMDEAEKLLDLVASHPEGKLAYATALNNRAAISQRKGDYAKAQQFYELAITKLDKAKKEELVLYAETLQNLALLNIDKKQTDQALNHINESHQLIVQAYGEKHPVAISNLNKQAIIFLKANEIRKSRAAFQKVLEFMQEEGHVNLYELVFSQTGLAQCYQRESNYRAADSLFQLVITRYQNGGMAPDENFMKTQLLFASCLQDQGKMREALAVLTQAISQIKRSKGTQNSLYVMLQEDLALLNLKLGFNDRARNQLDSAEAFYSTSAYQNTREYGALLLSKGRYHQVVGEYPKAETYLKKGADILYKLSGGDSETYASAMNALALYYQTMGNFSEAEPLFIKALTVREKSGGKLNVEYATVLQNLASLYQVQENYNKAEPLLQEANEIDRQVLGPDHPQYLVSLQNLATLYRKKRDLDKASHIMESVLLIAEKQNGLKQSSYATMLSNMASLYQDRGKYDEAEKLWKQCVELRKKILGEDHPDYAQSLYGLANVYFATGKLDQAAPYFAQVVDKYEHQIEIYFDGLSEREKGAFYNKIKPVFESYQDFSIQLLKQNPANKQIAEKLYDLQLSTKAILLNASNKVRNTILTSGDTELQNLFQQWLRAKEELVRYYNYSTEEKSRLNIDVARAEQNANDLEKKLTERSSHFESLNKKKVTWRDVQASLQPNEAAVEIIRIKKKFVTDSVYYAALVIHKQSEYPKLFIWPDGMKLENRWFRYHRNAIKFHLKDTLSYRHIWAPFLNEVPNMQTLYVSSDGVFNKINFNCVQDPVTGKWAVDEFNIRLVSNTREVTEKHLSMKAPSQQADIFGYADFNLSATAQTAATASTKRAARFGFQGEEIPMLPATKKELTLLNALLSEKNWKTSTFSLQDANEDNLKKISNPQILHIATHGFFLNDVDIEDELRSDEEVQMVKNPLFRSGILLAGAGATQNNNVEDGVLTAYEAMNLSLDNTELVSLSACETGLGEVRNGEGVYGLQRAFLVAGARTVIMSLWQVDDDATQELMTTFYKQWINGMDKFRAFRSAQLEIKEKYKLPYYWGAFVLIGN